MWSSVSPVMKGNPTMPSADEADTLLMPSVTLAKSLASCLNSELYLSEDINSQGSDKDRLVSTQWCSVSVSFCSLLSSFPYQVYQASKSRVSWRSPISIQAKHPRRRSIFHALYCTLLSWIPPRGYAFPKISTLDMEGKFRSITHHAEFKIKQPTLPTYLSIEYLDFCTCELWVAWITNSQHPSLVSPSVSVNPSRTMWFHSFQTFLSSFPNHSLLLLLSFIGQIIQS